VAFIVASVQLGRGWMRDRAGTRWAVRAVSAIAVVAAPFLLGAAASAYNNAIYPAYDEGQIYYPQGLTNDGQQIDNIFAFDANGDPIEQVQLFDQNGQPLNLTPETGAAWWDAMDGSMVVPSGDVPGRAGWNVYPLAHVNDWSDYEDDGQLDESEITQTAFPFEKVKPLAGHTVEAESAVAAPTPAPTTPAP
jgi:hypothetical protein